MLCRSVSTHDDHSLWVISCSCSQEQTNKQKQLHFLGQILLNGATLESWIELNRQHLTCRRNVSKMTVNSIMTTLHFSVNPNKCRQQEPLPYLNLMSCLYEFKISVFTRWVFLLFRQYRWISHILWLWVPCWPPWFYQFCMLRRFKCLFKAVAWGCLTLGSFYTEHFRDLNVFLWESHSEWPELSVTVNGREQKLKGQLVRSPAGKRWQSSSTWNFKSSAPVEPPKRGNSFQPLVFTISFFWSLPRAGDCRGGSEHQLTAEVKASSFKFIC